MSKTRGRTTQRTFHWLSSEPPPGTRVAVTVDNGALGLRVAQAWELTGDQAPDEAALWAAPKPDAHPMRLELTYDPAGARDPAVVVWFDDDMRGASHSQIEGAPAVVVRMELRPSGSGWSPGRITIDPIRGASTADLLRRIGMRDIGDAVEAMLRATLTQTVLGKSWAGRLQRRRAGRAGRDDLHYARWARAYVDACAVSATPVEFLLEDETNAGISKAALKATLKTARKRGLLTDAPSGRAGGELTGRARQLLGMV